LDAEPLPRHRRRCRCRCRRRRRRHAAQHDPIFFFFYVRRCLLPVRASERRGRDACDQTNRERDRKNFCFFFSVPDFRTTLARARPTRLDSTAEEVSRAASSPSRESENYFFFFSLGSSPLPTTLAECGASRCAEKRGIVGFWSARSSRDAIRRDFFVCARTANCFHRHRRRRRRIRSIHGRHLGRRSCGCLHLCAHTHTHAHTDVGDGEEARPHG
jgi:hypothetical protein